MVEAKDLKNGLSVNLIQFGKQINWQQNWHFYLIQTAEDFFKKRLILEKRIYSQFADATTAVLFLTEWAPRLSDRAGLPAEQSGHFPYLSEAGRGHGIHLGSRHSAEQRHSSISQANFPHNPLLGQNRGNHRPT